MVAKSVKSFLVAVFSLFIILFSNVLLAQHEGENGAAKAITEEITEEPEKIDAAKVIMEHMMDNHEFHFAEMNGHPVSIPLPVILYSPQRGFDAFMSSNFEHGHAIYNGYKMEDDKIVPVNENGQRR